MTQSDIKPQELWGIVISPIDVWAGSTETEFVIWENKYLKNPKLFETKAACEEYAIVYERENPPRYNMRAVCSSPPPGNNPIAVIPVEDLDIFKE